jgi:hypothetical protein
VTECTKIGGYFIGTSYDGKSVFDMLKDINMGDSVEEQMDGKVIWKITKRYDSDSFNDDSTSIGYKIDVFQESINKTFSEYLVNYSYFDRIMKNNGFRLLNEVESKQLDVPSGSELFNVLYNKMVTEIDNDNKILKDIGIANKMTISEKKISFLNRYFIYKKIQDNSTPVIINDDSIDNLINIRNVNIQDETNETNETIHINDLVRQVDNKHSIVIDNDADETGGLIITDILNNNAKKIKKKKKVRLIIHE